jgi:two-component system, chemotaxis family, sensor kinase CheA
VDDSITTRTLEKNILETAGYEVIVAVDGQDGWRAISEQTFDAVISDVEMPKMNGLELCARIKGNAQTRDLPVILLTSLSKPEQRAEGLRVGADAYLIKSQFNQEDLLHTLADVL